MRGTRRNRKTEDDTARTLDLASVEGLLGGGHGARPSEAAYVRETARILRAMSGASREIPIVTCEPGPDGLRIVGGIEAVQVAREMRARAAWRGDTNWAALLGRTVRFRIVTVPAGTTPRPNTSPAAQPAGTRSLLRGFRTMFALVGP